MARFASVSPVSGPRYVLLTQCLQNDFFLNHDCRLGLPEFVVVQMLLGKDRAEPGKADFSRDALKNGPLGRFLDATIGERLHGADQDGTLHVINIRDWHCVGPSYDDERRVYGRHCEAESWGAGYIEGLAHYLDPLESPPNEQAHYFAAGSVRIYHVHSDTLFDFKPWAGTTAKQRKFVASQLEDLLDVIVEGSDAELDGLHALLKRNPTLKELNEYATKAVKSVEETHAPVYVGAIGVYTDIKVKTLLTGIRTRYDLTNLAVSDTFTTSPTLERHLAGLDYAKKVLAIEVIHGINDFVRFLGGAGEVKDERSIVAAERYASYERFFQDQQNVLAYQNQRLQEYLALTERRAVRLYDTINRANRFLLLWGGIFLLASLAFMALSAVWPDRFDWKFSAITGGLGIAQFVGVFFTKSTIDLQKNLTNLAGFKMVLESHSLKTAIMRFHLTSARTLRPIETDTHAEDAQRQIDVLRLQLEAIGVSDTADFARLAALGFDGPGAYPATNGRANGEPQDGVAPAPRGPSAPKGAEVGDGASPAAPSRKAL